MTRLYQKQNNQIVPLNIPVSGSMEDGKLWNIYLDTIPESEEEQSKLTESLHSGAIIVTDEEDDNDNDNVDSSDNNSNTSNTNYHVYSTKEKVVGKWIDDRPIYEKVWHGEDKLLNKTILVDGVDEILQQYGNYSQSNDFSRLPIPYNTSVTVRLDINSTGQLFVNNTSSGAITRYTIVAQYTKISDLED